MSKSIADGSYRMVGTVRSASDPNAWYPVSLDVSKPRHAPHAHERPEDAPWNLSCVCPAWTRDQRGQHPRRSCKHTDPLSALLNKQRPEGLRVIPPRIVGGERIGQVIGANPALAHLTGSWAMQEFEAPVFGTSKGRLEPDPYHWFLLSVKLADLTQATGIVALPADEVPQDPRILNQTIAAWCGYQIAADVLLRAGQQPGVPPTYYRDEGRHGKRARKVQDGLRDAPKAPRQTDAPKYGIGDLMVAMHDADQGDGMTPAQRAEDLLRLMLGGQYAQVDPDRTPYQGYLDAPSKHPQQTLDYLWQLDRSGTGRRSLSGYGVPKTCRELVFRVRVDKGRKYDRRVRVWIDGQYRLDLCIVREGYIGSKVPVADGFLSRYLGFLANELNVLGVIGGYNLFPRFSDEGTYGHDPEGPPPARLHA